MTASRFFSTLPILGVLSSAALAQETRSASPPADEASYLQWRAERDADPVEATAGSAVHVDITVDWVSAYFFRGFLQERDDLIIQNSIEVGFDLLDPERDGPGLTAYFGVWNSFHEAATGAMVSDEFSEHWYESDLYLGLGASHDAWSFDAIYYVCASPSDAFTTTENLTLSVGYDDRGSDNFSLAPSVILAFETVGANDGADTGTYLELGLRPTFDAEAFARSIEISFPVSVGLSIDDFYQDATGRDHSFGFVDVGAEFAVDLPVDNRFGAWSLSGGIHWLVLGETTETANRGEGDQLHGRLGIAISF